MDSYFRARDILDKAMGTGSYFQIKSILFGLKAADVAEVRHGRWVWDTTGLYPKPICSRCGEEPYRRSNHTSDLPKYCPNCGALMREIKNGEK